MSVTRLVKSVFITQSGDMTDDCWLDKTSIFGLEACFNFHDAPGFGHGRWRIAVLCRPMAIATSEEEPWGCAANGVVAERC